MEQILPYLLAFFGGVFGAAIGGATSFILFGLMGIIGIGLIVATGSDVFLNSVALSPIIGPHVAFAGGVAAAAYMGKLSREGKLQTETGEVIEFAGSNIFAPLHSFGNTTSLVIGGVFGVIGFAILDILDNVIALKADNIAIVVVVTNIIARLAFGDGQLLSDLPKEVNKVGLITNNLLFNILWSFSLSIVMAGIIDVIQIPLFGFVLGAFFLVFIAAGVNVPMIHHVALIAGMAMQVFGNIWLAGLLGVISMILCEAIGVTFNANAKSHIDPPAATITILSLILLNFF